MTSKRRALALVVTGAALAIAAGGSMASNMGFKLRYTLQAAEAGVSKTGRQAIGLPYYRQVGIETAVDLLYLTQSFQIERFNEQLDTNTPYPGVAGNFPLDPAVGYLLRTVSTHDYIIAGSHDPGFTVSLEAAAPGVSKSGRTRYAHPYHGLSTTAGELLAETGAIQIERFNKQFDTNEPYPGPAGEFALVPGEAYLLRVATDTEFVPAHY